MVFRIFFFYSASCIIRADFFYQLWFSS